MKITEKIKNKILEKFSLTDTFIMIFFLMVSLLNRFWLLPDIATNVFRGIPNIYSWMALWNCRVLDTFNFASYWTSNAMFPYSNALAFSESMMGFTPFIYPIWKITGNPVLTINLLSLLFLWLSSTITYYVLRAFNFERFAAIAGSLMFAFYPWVLKLSSLGRFHMQGVIWMPIIVYANYKFWQSGKKKYLIIIFAFFLWTFLFSLYYGIFFTIFIGIWNFLWFFYEKEAFTTKKILSWALIVFLVWLVMLPVFLVYHQVSSGMGVERSLENQVQYTGNVWSWITVPDENWLWGKAIRFLPRGSRNGIIENFIFPGFIVSFLFIAAFFFKSFPKWLNALKWTALSLFILAIGPFMLGIPWKIPMPFTLLWYVFPPLKATRNPHRLAVFVVLAIIFLIAFMINYILKRKKISMVLKIIFISLLLLESFNTEKATRAIGTNTSLIYTKLKNSKTKHTLVELPMSIDINLKALTFSSFHWQRIINGSSDYWPPLLGYLKRKLYGFPSDNTVELLQAFSVDRIIIHEKKFSQQQKTRIIKALRERKEFQFLGKSANRSIWSLKKGKKFIKFDPQKHILVYGIENQQSNNFLIFEIPDAKQTIIFNYRAPFHSQFLSSKKWYLEIMDLKDNSKLYKIEWNASPVFSKDNCKFKIKLPANMSVPKNYKILLNIFGKEIPLKLKKH